jgi:hypothetical protein
MEFLLDWTALDVLAEQLDEAYRRGAFRELGLIPVLGTGRSLHAEVVAKTVLADIDHLRQWKTLERPGGSADGRREDLAEEIRYLLSYVDLEQS